MTLLKKLICIFLLSIVCITTSYAELAESFMVDQFKLTLEKSMIIIKRNGITKTLDTGLSGKVRFICTSDGTPQVEQTKWGTVFAVAQSVIIANTTDCKTVIRGLVIRDSGVYLSPRTQQIASCGYGPQDRKMFSHFAYMLDKQITEKEMVE